MNYTDQIEVIKDLGLLLYISAILKIRKVIFIVNLTRFLDNFIEKMIFFIMPFYAL